MPFLAARRVLARPPHTRKCPRPSPQKKIHSASVTLKSDVTDVNLAAIKSDDSPREIRATISGIHRQTICSSFHTRPKCHPVTRVCKNSFPQDLPNALLHYFPRCFSSCIKADTHTKPEQRKTHNNHGEPQLEITVSSRSRQPARYRMGRRPLLRCLGRAFQNNRREK